MKKKIILFLFIMVIIIVGIIIYDNSIKYYSITYSWKSYQIKETYNRKKVESYLFQIEKDNNNYFFTKKMSKKKKQVKDIKMFRKNQLVCIIPFFKSDEINQLYCSLNKKQVSISYLIEQENEDFKEIKKRVKKYKIKYPNSSDEKEKVDNIEVYNNNVGKEDIYLLWNYKGFYKITQEKTKNIKVLETDLYDNVKAIIQNNKFVLLDTTNSVWIKNIYLYDLKNDKLKTVNLKDKLSNDSYINGTLDNLLYITDRKNKKQYTWNNGKEELKEIDKDQTEYTIYNGNKKMVTITDFFKKYQIFNHGNYYDKYYMKDNKVYKYYDKKENSILLIELDNIKDWKVVDNQLLLVQDSMLLSYNETDGLRKIVKSNELKYNYKDIYYYGRK